MKNIKTLLPTALILFVLSYLISCNVDDQPTQTNTLKNTVVDGSETLEHRCSEPGDCTIEHCCIYSYDSYGMPLYFEKVYVTITGTDCMNRYYNCHYCVYNPTNGTTLGTYLPYGTYEFTLCGEGDDGNMYKGIKSSTFPPPLHEPINVYCENMGPSYVCPECGGTK